MPTVGQLIRLLEKNHDIDEAIVFQFMVAEHTDLSEEEFEPVADYLMDNDSFADELSDTFNEWIAEAQDVLSGYGDDDEEEEETE
jgi:hypothetical protein